jgi:eukaryotic-like serine/threonine-protein kinase
VIGEILGKQYKLVSLLGRGGMGTVYEGICQESGDWGAGRQRRPEASIVQPGRRVAVKVLHDHLAQGDTARRFRREAEAAQRIRSEHIVQIAEAGTCDVSGKLYLVTELLEGKDLQHWIDRIGPLSIRGALRLTLQALRGLRDAHISGVVHRDIKPGNLFLAQTESGALKLKILDFGIAKIHRDPFLSGGMTNVTASGSLLGSPLYMSPEQVQDSRRVDHRTDIWSLGSVLYATLSGRAPFQHISSIGPLLVAISVQRVKPIVNVAPWVPAEVAAIVHRALENDPEARYPNAEAMLMDIERLVGDGEILEEDLLSSGQGFRAAYLSNLPPVEETPRHVVGFVVGSGDEQAVRGAKRPLRRQIPLVFPKRNINRVRWRDQPFRSWVLRWLVGM